ncbi:hypothetical protein SNE26_20410 [Mucilaginibacter sp. cycad4]|uniref:hypothetical protein n=1 Tax=Mucilaginibacter sp. cycad4 TaxID=3342096 RepID=UPI002AAB54E9|nr:hypothetical protein [Mucilaginibacter gossypii]WPU98392.1 hypothetical protein SNE26_20410 [Mucilaginibacter gossypii]
MITTYIPHYDEALEFINYSVVEALGFKQFGVSGVLKPCKEIYRLGNVKVVFSGSEEVIVTESDEVRNIRRTTELVALLYKKAAV